MNTKTPTVDELIRLKPNAKGGMYMVASKEIGYRYMPRLGRHGVHCQGEPQLFEKEADALESAKRFKAQLQSGAVKSIGDLAK